MEGRPVSPPAEEIIVRADEVDEAGADISTILSTDEDELRSRVEARRQQDLETPGTSKVLANAVPDNDSQPATRPILRREASAPPPPPRQPPPPAPSTQPEDVPNGTESLSLAQLRNLVTNIPKLEPTAYAYTYDDTRTFPEELEEWFQYSEEDRSLLWCARRSFEEKFGIFGEENSSVNIQAGWHGLSMRLQERFIKAQLSDLKDLSLSSTTRSLECISYLAMGVWKESRARTEEPDSDEEHDYEPPNYKYRQAFSQLKCIARNAKILCKLGGLQALYKIIQDICGSHDHSCDNTGHSVTSNGGNGGNLSFEFAKGRQLGAALTSLYFLVETGRWEIRKSADDLVRRAFVALEPGILQYLSDLIAKLRWDDTLNIPFTKVLLLLWKSLLLVFGDSEVLSNAKKTLRRSTIVRHRTQLDEDKDEIVEVAEKDQDETELTASPLDYHIFRQEIISKYPAYNPPKELIPIEINNNSMLPPLPSQMSQAATLDNLQGLGSGNGIGKSIFNQPVHISTPAPSPPPSPGAAGGKGGKKQNYQTNQNFPFLYPPLDSSSNDLGGKGNAEMQDRLVGKKWEGSDIPESILEAAQLFADRMRMSRSLRQLWEVRDEFMKYERAVWRGEDMTGGDRAAGSDIELGRSLDKELRRELIERALNEDSVSGFSAKDPENTAENSSSPSSPIESSKETDDELLQGRLDAIEIYYRSTLPHLQSILIVLLKVLLSNITVLGNQANAVKEEIVSDANQVNEAEDHFPSQNLDLSKHLASTTNEHRPEGEVADRSLEELNAIRTREVTSKAIQGFLLMLLKWLRLSHVLKFEYMTQLLLDSNYLPLALKYFALQDVDKAVDLKNDREDLDFFEFCAMDGGFQLNQTRPTSLLGRPVTPQSSDDEAQPPPISRKRRVSSASNSSSPPPSPGSSPSPPRRPEVDELGYPTNAQPNEPLTTYAPRFFHTHITTLRILQKLTKSHAHRALLLVQYKSSTILRKNLKIPQPDLRLYTLKLFKSQVPYCGRKWRQVNMRVITAIYVFCRMGLRDEWISGGGMVEEWVDGATSVEKAWRGLVGWWHGREYRDCMGLQSAPEEENDFFTRELEKMGWGVGGFSETIEAEAPEHVDWDQRLETW